MKNSKKMYALNPAELDNNFPKPTVLHKTDKHKIGRFHKSYHLEVSRKVNTVNILTGTASSGHWTPDKMSRSDNFYVLVLCSCETRIKLCRSVELSLYRHLLKHKIRTKN